MNPPPLGDPPGGFSYALHSCPGSPQHPPPVSQLYPVPDQTAQPRPDRHSSTRTRHRCPAWTGLFHGTLPEAPERPVQPFLWRVLSQHYQTPKAATATPRTPRKAPCNLFSRSAGAEKWSRHAAQGKNGRFLTPFSANFRQISGDFPKNFQKKSALPGWESGFLGS